MQFSLVFFLSFCRGFAYCIRDLDMFVEILKICMYFKKF